MQSVTVTATAAAAKSGGGGALDPLFLIIASVLSISRVRRKGAPT
jgi:hypothetical protein